MRSLLSKAAQLKTLYWGLLFGLAYSQSPLYTSNQNQYFLHAFARAGIGLLEADWLANTRDPAPLFTALVQATVAWMNEGLFYLYALALLGLYFYSLTGIVESLKGFELGRSQRTLWAGALILLHSAALRLLLARVLGGEWEYIFDGGVAGQRLLGPVLQPSMFGVLLLLSVRAFLHGHRARAVVFSALAATMHATYLPGAALITLSYLFLIWREDRSLRSAALYGLLAVALVLPVLTYIGLTFYPASGAAQEILADFRLPAHTDPAIWLDATTLVKLAIIGLAIYLVRRSRLFPILLISAVAGLVLSVVQIALDHAGLALLFPWRVSTYLVPLSTAVLAAWLVRNVRGFPERVSHTGTLALALAGAFSFALKLEAQQAAPEMAVMRYVRHASQVGDLYLIPPRMQDFRLEAQAPVLADFKSIPYDGEEVQEWYRRNRLLGWFYRDTLADIDCGLVSRFRDEYGVTHIVLGPLQMGLECQNLQPRYDDDSYAVMKVLPEG